MQKLKVELEIAEAGLLLNVLNKVQFSGVGVAEQILSIVKKLQNPTNAEELGEDVLNGLQFIPADKEGKPLKEKKK